MRRAASLGKVLKFTSRQQIDSIIDHAKEEYPNECCGIIAGKGSVVKSIIKMENELESSIEYSMNSGKVKKVLDKLDEAGLDFIGIYHSHPEGDAYPSNIDIKKAIFPEVDYLIISLKDKDKPNIRNFKISSDEVIKEQYMIDD